MDMVTWGIGSHLKTNKIIWKEFLILYLLILFPWLYVLSALSLLLLFFVAHLSLRIDLLFGIVLRKIGSACCCRILSAFV
jgi:hypothetical protein